MAQGENLVAHRSKYGHRKKFTEGLLNSNLILNELNILPGQIVIDAGCGNGYMSMLFSEQVGESGEVYALDLNTHFIESLCDEIVGLNITAMTCDIANSIPLSSSSANLLYTSTVLHSQSKEQLKRVIQEVERLLCPGGLFAVVEIEKHDTSFGPPLKQRYSPEELREAIPFAPVKTVSVAEHFYMQVFQMPTH